MLKKILITIAALAALMIILQPVSAAIIYPYTNINDGVLTAGTTLIHVSNPNQAITLQGSGYDVYFDTSSFVKGTYSTSLGNSGYTYSVYQPDSTIQILRNGVPDAEIYGKTISSSEYLKIIVTPTNINYKPYALSIKTDAGGVTTYFGNMDTKVGSATGLVDKGSYLEMTTEPLKDIGITSGSFDIAALYDRNIFREGIPDEFLTGTYYSKQHEDKPTVKPTSTPTKTTVPKKTPTPSPTKTATVEPTNTQTPEPATSVPTPTAAPTKSPVYPAVIIAGLIFAGVTALMRK